MRLWDKGQALDAQIAAFTVGEDPEVDLAWARHDILGSRAHLRVLEAAGLVTAEEATTLDGGLAVLQTEIEAGNFSIPFEEEDVHTAVEARLTERLGAVAGKLHTGRSRNDQVLTALRLWQREEADAIAAEWRDLAAGLLDFAESHASVPLTGYTHLQRAMPSSYGLWAVGFAAALLDLRPLLVAARVVIDRCPLGSAAGYGTPLPLDRQLAASLLGFAQVEEPVTTSQLTRGATEVALLSALSAATGLVSRLAWDISLFTTSEFALLRLPDAFTTGSSIMPQKRNPDAAELVRAKTGRINGSLIGLLTVMKGLPLAYAKDMQEDKEPVFDAAEAWTLSLAATAGMVRDMTPDTARLRAFAGSGFATATDLADWLVRVLKVPFRVAHHVTGRLVAMAEAKGVDLADLSLAEMQSVEPGITVDIFSVLTVEASVASRTSFGGTAQSNVAREAAKWLETLS